MNDFIRAVLRIASIIGIVLFCGATSCTQPVGDITYAPGYGYVVKVHRNAGLTGGEDRNYYYIFPTEERAAEFYHEYYVNPNGFRDTLRPGERVVNDDDKEYEEYNKITKLLQPVPPPPPLNETEIPLSVPELPQPIPQTPQ